MSEWFRALKVEAFVGIRRSDLDPILAELDELVLQEFGEVLDANTIREPLHVALVDQGLTANTTEPVLVLEAVHVQPDFTLNEIPRATCVLATGRDGAALAYDGATDRTASSVVHLIERYLNRFVPARIYARAQVTSTAGAPDGELGDFVPEPAEWVVLFEGKTLGPTRRGTPESYEFVLHITHLLADLTFSSSLSGNVSTGTEMPYAFNSLLYQPGTTTNSGYGWATSAGMLASTLAGGPALYTDFWGYNVPQRVSFNPLQTATVPAQGGLKQFLLNLAKQDMFNWQAFLRADLNAAKCIDYGKPRKNDKALTALNSIEPGENTGVNPRTDWNAIELAVRKIREQKLADGSIQSVDRADLIRVIGRARYNAVGYRYGMPISFYLNGAPLGAFGTATGFAMDIAAASFHDLAPASYWELLSSKYASRYQIAVAPTATGALVIPFQPLLDRTWQTVYASEIFSWDDNVINPIPVRGVVLQSQRKSDAGYRPAGIQGGDPAGANAMTTADAAYDSCEDGVFVYRMMPTWLALTYRNPAVWAPSAIMGPRSSAATPWTTAVRAAQGVAALVGGVPAAAGLVGAAVFAAAEINPNAPTAPSEATRSTANRMAKALYQQIRTQPKSVYVTCRYRYDIAPGSLVRLELPGDRYVKKALTGNRDTHMVGMVLRVTVQIDAERKTASTSLQIGFVRTEGEAGVDSPTFSNGHPYWLTSTLGCPLADAQWVRNRLGDRADITTRIPAAV